mgnify:FL=1
MDNDINTHKKNYAGFLSDRFQENKNKFLRKRNTSILDLLALVFDSTEGYNMVEAYVKIHYRDEPSIRISEDGLH